MSRMTRWLMTVTSMCGNQKQAKQTNSALNSRARPILMRCFSRFEEAKENYFQGQGKNKCTFRMKWPEKDNTIVCFVWIFYGSLFGYGTGTVFELSCAALVLPPPHAANLFFEKKNFWVHLGRIAQTHKSHFSDSGKKTWTFLNLHNLGQFGKNSSEEFSFIVIGWCLPKTVRSYKEEAAGPTILDPFTKCLFTI